ncbi:hypothetical protein CPC08DRAFT_689508 [Agrocybe pediades]|nr:hypothetical protein CPC08DRAFT_689508 [Agrocybe pediades]
MPGFTPATNITLAAFVALCAVSTTSYALWTRQISPKDKKRIRKQLPVDLDSWRTQQGDDEIVTFAIRIWETLRSTCLEHGYTIWPGTPNYNIYPPDWEHKLPLASGFTYEVPARTVKNATVSKVSNVSVVRIRNAMSWPASTRDGHAVVIRVIKVHEEGKEHLDILRKLTTGMNSLWVPNHTLPMFAEIHLEDIVFGVFPKVGYGAENAYDMWAKNSVGDVLEMLMQMLEALEFIHSLNIAHRDAWLDNFLVQWHPESMLKKDISPSRPRVYLIDFEVAVQFPSEYTEEQCLLRGLPLGGSFPDAKDYGRSIAPECETGELHSPFKLDIWQLGTALEHFRTTFSNINTILDGMIEENWRARKGAADTLKALKDEVYSIPPLMLLTGPDPEYLLYPEVP